MPRMRLDLGFGGLPFGARAPRAQMRPDSIEQEVVRRWLPVNWQPHDVRKHAAWYSAHTLIYGLISERMDSLAYVEPMIEGPREAMRLAYEPDYGVDFATWWANAILWHDVAGDVFLYRRRVAMAAQSGRPGEAAQQPVRRAGGRLAGYELLRSDWVAVRPDGDGYVFGPLASAGVGAHLPLEDVAHFRTPNPASNYYGIGPVGVAARMLELDQRATQFTAEWVHNKGRTPGGFLMLPGERPASETERAATLMDFQASLTGAGDLVALYQGAKYEAGSPMESPEMVPLRELTESRIISAFRAEGRGLGVSYAVKASSGTSDFRQASLAWAEKVLAPLYKKFGRWYQQVLRDDFGPAIKFAFDLSAVPAMREVARDRENRAIALVKAGLLTRDEGREFIAYDACDDGDRGNEMAPLTGGKAPRPAAAPATATA